MKYQRKTFTCKNKSCGIEYTIETDGELSDPGLCVECRKQKESKRNEK